MKIGKFEVNSIYRGDCRDLIPLLPTESIDLIIADPPFGIAFHGKPSNYHRTSSRVIEGYQEVEKDYEEFTFSWLSPCFRVLKEEGSLYLFSSWNNLREVLNAVYRTPFKTINHLIWKYQFGVFTHRKFVTSHYHILLLVKNESKYKFRKIEHYPEDVIEIKREYWAGKEKTPTKLPVSLVRKLISFSSEEGDVVLDPFMGSGTTAIACLRERRKFIGFEIVPEYVEFALKRISQESEVQYLNFRR